MGTDGCQKKKQEREAEGMSFDYATEHPAFQICSGLLWLLVRSVFQLYFYYTYLYFNFVLRP